MTKLPPSHGKGVGGKRLYRVRRIGPTYYFDIITRQVFWDREGKRVRYGCCWRRLYEPRQFRSLLREIASASGTAYHRYRWPRRITYAKDRGLPFIKTWESNLGPYPQAFD